MTHSVIDGAVAAELDDFAGLDPTAEPKTTAPPSWERRAEEGQKPYAAFRVFIELGDQRSCSAVARKLVVSKTLITRWPAVYAWQERAREWDEHVSKLTLNNIVAARVRLGLEQVQIAGRMFALVKKSLPRLHKLDTQDTARLFVAAVRALEQVFGDQPLTQTQPPKVNIMINRDVVRFPEYTDGLTAVMEELALPRKPQS